MKNELKRDLKTPGAILMGLGSIIGTGIFVSIAIATQITGNGITIAIIIAAILATLNGLSSAQLAAAHPVRGGYLRVRQSISEFLFRLYGRLDVSDCQINVCRNGCFSDGFRQRDCSVACFLPFGLSLLYGSVGCSCWESDLFGTTLLKRLIQKITQDNLY